MTDYWIQDLKKGTYRRQLERLGLIKPDEKIPLTISRKICNAEVGSYVTIKGKRVHVTELLKRRACTHLTLSRLRKRRRKGRRRRSRR